MAERRLHGLLAIPPSVTKRSDRHSHAGARFVMPEAREQARTLRSSSVLPDNGQSTLANLGHDAEPVLLIVNDHVASYEV
jgi:hypothetical protein